MVPTPREPDEWEIVSVALPQQHRVGPLKETVEAKPRPAEPPDPRPAIIRNIPRTGPPG